MKPEMMAMLRMRKTVSSTVLTPDAERVQRRLATACEAKAPQSRRGTGSGPC